MKFQHFEVGNVVINQYGLDSIHVSTNISPIYYLELIENLTFLVKIVEVRTHYVMKARQVEALTSSFREIEKVGYDAGIAFYQELFVKNPELKELFKGDMSQQVEKFMSTVKLVVFSFEPNESGEYLLGADLTIPLLNLGRKHVEHGVSPAMYSPVEDALLATLQKILGDSFTAELKETWSLAYWEVARHMKAELP